MENNKNKINKNTKPYIQEFKDVYKFYLERQTDNEEVIVYLVDLAEQYISEEIMEGYINQLKSKYQEYETITNDTKITDIVNYFLDREEETGVYWQDDLEACFGYVVEHIENSRTKIKISSYFINKEHNLKFISETISKNIKCFPEEKRLNVFEYEIQYCNRHCLYNFIKNIEQFHENDRYNITEKIICHNDFNTVAGDLIIENINSIPKDKMMNVFEKIISNERYNDILDLEILVSKSIEKFPKEKRYEIFNYVIANNYYNEQILRDIENRIHLFPKGNQRADVLDRVNECLRELNRRLNNVEQELDGNNRNNGRV